VILLNFPPYLGEVFAPTPERPVAKCAVCSYRLTAAEVVEEEEPFPE
jgi:C4-type Zn-finger protein